DGLLVEGSDEQQVLRGQATRTLLPRLLPLLDGTRTLSQLMASLPEVPAGHTQQAVALLYTRGLLEDAGDDPEVDDGSFDPRTLAFFRRNVDATRVNRSAWQAARRVMNAEVVVYGDGEDSVAYVTEGLRASGVRMVRRGDFGGQLTFAARLGAKLVVAL